jgi:nitrile hydratase
MNGVHDMGGMHGFGRVRREENEPVFHEMWEGRLVGMRNVAGTGVQRPGGFRYATESLDPAFYLSASYYERWLETFVAGLVKRGLITAEELAQRIDLYAEEPDAPLPRTENPEKAREAVERLRRRQDLHHYEVTVAPRFQPGDEVRARNIHSRGHTRMPRYVRGKRGVICRCYGVHDVLDHEAPDDPIPPPQPVYSVRFDMEELWGDSAEPGEYLYIDLWESHLQPA